MKFGSEVTEFSIGALLGLDKIQGVASAKLAEAITRSTPVGDPNLWNISDAKRQQIIASGYRGGALRGNWQVTNGALPAGETGRIDPSGSQTINEQKSAAVGAKIGTKTYISNLRPYAGLIEYGKNGTAHSVQQPVGAMVRANLTKWSVFVREAVTEVRKARIT